ncbi:hypothetical protein B0I35DRAFT_8459 [Stachybotrys elegans]|uniref:Uncharacterized protein n=1 Tax=Stachybotrys elegans TaxID=80388 RepID=A0A8K0T0P2_9HYPO|nr:hypothetical protein B0I35DRAFT_8459 [Stachybotrys elegans]
MSRSLITLAMAGTALAQAAPVVDIIVPAAGPVTLVGSVIGVADALTTYAVACPGPSDECPLGDATMTLTQGPSFWAMATTVEIREGEATATQEAQCDLDFPRDMATCTAVIEVGGEGAQSATETVEGIQTIMAPVRITAGANLLSEDDDDATTTRGPTRTTQTSAPETTATTQATETSAEETETTGSSTTTTGAPASESTPSDQDEDDNAAGRAGQNVMLAGLIAAAGAMLLL